jgi:hypothetical protein
LGVVTKIKEITSKKLPKDNCHVRFNKEKTLRILYAEDEEGNGLPVKCPISRDFARLCSLSLGDEDEADEVYDEYTIDRSISLEDSFVPHLEEGDRFKINHSFVRSKTGVKPVDPLKIKEVAFLHQKLLPVSGKLFPPPREEVLLQYRILVHKIKTLYSSDGACFKNHETDYQSLVMSEKFQKPLLEAVQKYKHYMQLLGITEIEEEIECVCYL